MGQEKGVSKTGKIENKEKGKERKYRMGKSGKKGRMEEGKKSSEEK